MYPCKARLGIALRIPPSAILYMFGGGGALKVRRPARSAAGATDRFRHGGSSPNVGLERPARLTTPEPDGGIP